jgi:hypothetical protein
MLMSTSSFTFDQAYNKTIRLKTKLTLGLQYSKSHFGTRAAVLSPPWSHMHHPFSKVGHPVVCIFKVYGQFSDGISAVYL